MSAKRTRIRLQLLLAAALAAALTFAVPSGAEAQSSTQKGPDPTERALERDGPYQIRSTEISDFSTPGFGAATLYYPETTSEGTFGGIVIAPGYTESRSPFDWLAERLASHGFVVLNIDVNNTFLDQPSSRGGQILDAIDYLRDDSPARDRVDGTRIGVSGHSMGGGGTLTAISRDPSIDAAVPLTPYHTDKTWGEVTTPTLVIAGENDAVAPVSSHASRFYNSFSSSLEKAYMEENNGSHFIANSSNDLVSLYTVAWMKRYVDDDTRYAQFICPGPGTSFEISDYRSDCSEGDDDNDDDDDDNDSGDCPWWAWWC